MFKIATSGVLNSIASPIKSFVRNHPFPTSFQYLLQNLPQMQYTKLDNGLTVVTEERELFNASIGIFVSAGARYESSFENGITHFFEHIAYKGTNARTRTVLEEQMTATGARFDCVTSREIAGYRVHCLCQHVPLCVDILTDCIFNNAYFEPDIEKQKKVVYQEMQDHDRDPNCLLEDYLHISAFQGTPLEQTVMGPSCNILNFNGMTISRFMNKYFDANRTVLVAIGGVKHEQIVSLACTYMSKLEPTKCMDSDVYRFTGSEIRARDDSLPVATVAIAVEAPALCDDERVPMEVAAEVIGGWDRSQGSGYDHSYPIARASAVAHLSDAYQAFYISYRDTGLWGVKFMGPSLKLDDMLVMVQEEFMNLCNMVTVNEVQRAKRVMKTKLLSEDVDMARMCSEAGRWTLLHGHRQSLADRISAVEDVTASDVQAACQRYVYDQCPVVAAVGPSEGLNDYTRIRAGMYWLRL